MAEFSFFSQNFKFWYYKTKKNAKKIKLFLTTLFHAEAFTNNANLYGKFLKNGKFWGEKAGLSL